MVLFNGAQAEVAWVDELPTWGQMTPSGPSHVARIVRENSPKTMARTLLLSPCAKAIKHKRCCPACNPWRVNRRGIELRRHGK
jgi:hypothetical protein